MARLRTKKKSEPVLKHGDTFHVYIASDTPQYICDFLTTLKRSGDFSQEILSILDSHIHAVEFDKQGTQVVNDTEIANNTEIVQTNEAWPDNEVSKQQYSTSIDRDETVVAVAETNLEPIHTGNSVSGIETEVPQIKAVQESKQESKEPIPFVQPEKTENPETPIQDERITQNYTIGQIVEAEQSIRPEQEQTKQQDTPVTSVKSALTDPIEALRRQRKAWVSKVPTT